MKGHPGHFEDRLAGALAQLEQAAGELGRTVAHLIQNDPTEVQALIARLEVSRGNEGLGEHTDGIRDRAGGLPGPGKEVRDTPE